MIEKQKQIERRKILLELIKDKNVTDVNFLHEVTNFAKSTIHRDIHYLQNKGLIPLVYGNKKNRGGFVDKVLQGLNISDTKIRIAKKMADFIKDNDTIFINTSLTAIATLAFIKASNVTIITNNLKALQFVHKKNLIIILTGGEIVEDETNTKNILIGDFAIATLKLIGANKCILGCDGINNETVTTKNRKENIINNIMIERTIHDRFIVADSSKIGLINNFSYIRTKDVNFLITNDVKKAKQEISVNLQIIDCDH